MGKAYDEYKTCEQLFIDWLTAAAAAVQTNSKGWPHSAKAMRKRVNVIVNQESVTALAGKKQEHLDMDVIRKNLLAGYRAFELRQEVNNFYVIQHAIESNTDLAAIEADASHAYYCSNLGDCVKTLLLWFKPKRKEWMQLQFSRSDAPAHSEHQESAPPKPIVGGSFNALLDHEFDTEDEFDSLVVDDKSGINWDTEALHSKYADMTAEDIGVLFGELRLRVVCLLLDMKNALKRMDKIWRQVKEGTACIVTAASITTVAIDWIDTSCSELTTHHPSIQNASDFLLVAARRYFPTAIAKASNKSGIHQLYDKLVQQLEIVQSFYNGGKHPRAHERRIMYDRYEANQPVLVEQESTIPDTQSAMENFFHGEFANLRNYMMFEANDREAIFKKFPAMHSFVGAFLDFFATQTATMGVVFRCMCWRNVVLILQSTEKLSMGRVIYQARKYSRRLHEMLLLEHPSLQIVQEKYREYGQEFFSGSENNLPMDSHYPCYCHNPILAGAQLVDMVAENSFMTLGFQTVFNQVCHLYNALQKEGFIEQPIPVLELFMNQMGHYIFPGGVRSEKGKYFTTSALKGGRLSVQAIAAVRRNQPLPATVPILAPASSSRHDNEPCCEMKHIICDKDLSQVVDSDMNITEALEAIEHVCDHELFGSRMLSLHTVKCMRLFYCFYFQILKIMPEIGRREQSFAGSSPEYPVQTVAVQTAQAVNLYVFRYLDDDGGTGSNSVSQLGKALAETLRSTFSSLKFEEEMFLFPSKWPHYSEDFGGVSPPKIAPDPWNPLLREAMYIFKALIDKLSSTRLSGSKEEKLQQKKYLVQELKFSAQQWPAILILADESQELPTLIDHCTCGVLADMQLAEWMIQMRGMLLRGDFKQVVSLGRAPGAKPFNTHLTIACKKRVLWAAELLLAASQGYVLMYNNQRRGNCALHYCMLHNDEELIEAVMQYSHGWSPFNEAEQACCDLLTDTALRERYKGRNVTNQEHEAMRRDQQTQDLQHRQESGHEEGKRLFKVKKDLKKQIVTSASAASAADIAAAAKTSDAIAAQLVAEEDEELTATTGTKKSNKKSGSSNKKKKNNKKK